MNKVQLFVAFAACGVVACGDHEDGANRQADANLRRDAEMALASEPALSIAAKNVGVSASRGVLELQGSVATDADRRRIEAVVRATPGDVALTDGLEVSTTRDRDDAESDRRIEDAIDIQTDLGSVRVTSQHGLVTVAGRVGSDEQATHILHVANTMPGVAAVDDELQSP